MKLATLAILVCLVTLSIVSTSEAKPLEESDMVEGMNNMPAMQGGRGGGIGAGKRGGGGGGGYGMRPAM
jgi:hypothetical protein